MKDSKKGRYFTAVSLGTAAVWFSTHCGAGFASGTQELQYFVNHGWFGPLMPLLAMAIVAFTFYVGIESARQTDTWNYNGWSKQATEPIGRFCSVMMDVGIIITTISATAASLASGATLIAQTFHVPTMIGSIIMLACVTVICIFGASLVRKNAMVMTVGILVIIAIILVMGLAKFWPNIVELFKEGYVNPEASKWSVTGSSNDVTQGTFGNAILWALTYAGFQVTAIGGVAASFKGAMSRKESKGAMIVGYVINVIMLCGICFLIFSGMPEVYTDPEAKLLPTVWVVNHLDSTILAVIYPILLFLALITTAVGFTFGMVERLNPYVLKNMKNATLRNAIIALICLLVSYGVSTMGLMWVVQVAYKYLGIYNWIFVILPLWILGLKNIRKRRLASMEQLDNK